MKGGQSIFIHMVEYQDRLDNTLNLAFAALADPTRRAIYARLVGGEKTVTELANPFAMSLNAVSKHIKKLERAGLVSRRRAGRLHFLAARSAPFDQASEWFEQHRRLWNRCLDRLEAELESDESGSRE